MTWAKNGTTDLGSPGDNVSVATLPDTAFNLVLSNLHASGYILNDTRFNSDTGNNYAWRRALNGASDSTSVSTDFISQSDSGAQIANLSVEYIYNLSSAEKLTISNVVENPSAGAGTVPSRIETVGKWANTSDTIDEITKYNDHSGDYTTDSNCSVLGTN